MTPDIQNLSKEWNLKCRHRALDCDPNFEQIFCLCCVFRLPNRLPRPRLAADSLTLCSCVPYHMQHWQLLCVLSRGDEREMIIHMHRHDAYGSGI
jgi:hypothetical protein